jgi:hypothetical protein
MPAMFEIKGAKAMFQLIRQTVPEYMAFLPSTLR